MYQLIGFPAQTNTSQCREEMRSKDLERDQISTRRNRPHQARLVPAPTPSFRLPRRFAAQTRPLPPPTDWSGQGLEVTRRDNTALAVPVTTQPGCASTIKLPNESTTQNLLPGSRRDTTSLRTPHSISWKQQRGTANSFLRLRLYPKPLTNLKNLLCSSDMCYFPIMRN